MSFWKYLSCDPEVVNQPVIQQRFTALQLHSSNMMVRQLRKAINVLYVLIKIKKRLAGKRSKMITALTIQIAVVSQIDFQPKVFF